MPPRSARRRKRIRGDSVLFAFVLFVLVVGFGVFAAYHNGYLDGPSLELREDHSAGNDRQSDRLFAASTPSTKTLDPIDQPTLLIESEPHAEVYNSLSESERESLQRMADAIDAALNGRRYEGELSEMDLAVADRYSILFNPVRWRDYWYRIAVRTAGFSRFQELRHRGDEDEFQSAAIDWAQLDGITRGLLLEALQAIAEEDEELQTVLQDAIQQYPSIVGSQEPTAPLRAPRP